MDGFYSTVSRLNHAVILTALPHDACHALHLIATSGDSATAQRLLRETTQISYTSAPAAPAAALALRPRVVRRRRLPIRSVR